MLYDRIIAFRNDKTIFHHEDKCIKVFGSSYSQSDVYEEALNQIKAREVGNFNVPEVKSVILNDNKWAIVNEYIEGLSMKEVLYKHPEREDELFERFVDLQIKVQSQKVSSLLPMYFKFEKYRNNKHLKNIDFNKKSMCHLDFNGDNVVLSQKNELFIIDWANLVSGDELYDTASTYLNILFVQGERLAEKYINLYTAKTGTKKQDILKLLKAVATVRLEKAVGHRIEFLKNILNS